MPIITLLTDFGTQDYFVAAMKGVILSVNPDAQIVDISHDIPPQDIQAGAFNLLAVYRDFPVGTIHTGVVDPGVGSERRAIIVECAGQFFVGPDNGLFSFIVQREGKCSIHQVTNEKFLRHPVSSTFHGRDVFAPVAAALSNGADARAFGSSMETIVELASLTPDQSSDGTIACAIIHIDRFGNCVTNLTLEDLGGHQPSALQIQISGRQISSFRQFFAETSAAADDLFMFLGSAGFIEIAARNASAAATLNAKRGQTIVANIRPRTRETSS